MEVNCEIVNSDRQFCRTVHVISWTVVLILSSRKIKWKRKFKKNQCAHVCIIPRLCWQKQGTFLFEAWPDLAEKGDILNTGNLDLWSELILEIFSLVTCLSPVKELFKQWNFWGREEKEKWKRQTQNWRNCEPVSDIFDRQYSRKWILEDVLTVSSSLENSSSPLVNCYHHWN